MIYTLSLPSLTCDVSTTPIEGLQFTSLFDACQAAFKLVSRRDAKIHITEYSSKGKQRLVLIIEG